MLKKDDLVHLLTYAGSLPFMGCAFLKIMGFDNLFDTVPINDILLTYSLIIFSFMSGTLWANSLHHTFKRDTIYIVASNILVLSVWASFLFFTPAMTLPLMIIGYIMLYIFDRDLSKNGILNSSYLQLRFNITIIVCFSLLLYWIFL